jgi:hypothetical protein
VTDATDETWKAIGSALRLGGRGLSGGISLPRLLAERRGARNRSNLPRLTIDCILVWADEHRRRYKEWPNTNSGPVPGAPDENWAKIQSALRIGSRGLPGGKTLAQLLAEHRGLRNRWSMGRLTIRQILIWASKHKRRTGYWPDRDSGSIPGAPGESWHAINVALDQGCRGLPGGETLRQLLDRRRRHRARR